MIVDNGVVTQMELEPDGFGLSCSLSSSMIDQA
jgi:peroxiredoxin